MNLAQLNRILLPILLFIAVIVLIYFILESERRKGIAMIGDKYTDLINTTILKNWALRAEIICTMNGFQSGVISIEKDDIFLFCVDKKEGNKIIDQKFPLNFVEIMGEESRIVD